jgi:Restriction endonuclease
MRRHLSFAQGCDLHDIADHDWPSVKQDIESALYGALDPVPVSVSDLAEIASTQPVGKVSTELAWSVLSNEGFERLVFNLILDAPGYENARWLTHTSAPDHGRDLSVDRVVTDSWGVMRSRVIIQCKHWLSRSIAPSDVAAALAAIKLCEPPPVDVLIIATSGRFSADAVTWIEKHNHERTRPAVEPWPESHLESALAERAPLVAEFGLRPRT